MHLGLPGSHILRTHFMPIRYFPNDPAATTLPAREVVPAPDRDDSVEAGFSFGKLPDEREYPDGTRDFVRWQCREGVLRAVRAWESVGGHMAQWQKKGSIKVDAVNLIEKGAFYKPGYLKFGRVRHDGGAAWAGASVDIVAHEVGHAILDSLRHDLYNSPWEQVDAFHEGFSDVISVLTALSDRAVRERLVQSGEVGRQNDAVRIGEELAEARFLALAGGATVLRHETGPRRALNFHQWTGMVGLPLDGAPNELVATPHSLGQLISGAYYDFVRLIFEGSSRRNERTLHVAAKIATAVLRSAIVEVRETKEFFRAIAKELVLAQKRLFGKKYRKELNQALELHGLHGAHHLVGAAMDSVVVAGLDPAARRIDAPQRARILDGFGGADDVRVCSYARSDGQRGIQVECLVDVSPVDPSLAGVHVHIRQGTAPNARGDAVIDTHASVEETARARAGRLLSSGAIKSIGLPGESVTHRLRKSGSRLLLERQAFVCH